MVCHTHLYLFVVWMTKWSAYFLRIILKACFYTSWNTAAQYWTLHSSTFKENTDAIKFMWYLATGVLLIVLMLDFSTYLSVLYVGPYILECVKLLISLSKMHYTVSVCLVMGADHHTTPLPAVVERRDLSHPVHSDNCILNEATGECDKVPPAYTWRDYRSVEGGMGCGRERKEQEVERGG